ncbi:hypothetical protein [Streptomyces lancefieldiae]|uniref:Uncharacterized protein n=1 Tax=Streptomyces lancefieldiae TaxID=3075520 RepID=A0ABU3B1C5_9ACTN|nr:hypothetical protein [Streptomyces sp. DSM 40712]MDT0616253.1 hypothetical protein [Streptomyces sp. DSM 40712]
MRAGDERRRRAELAAAAAERRRRPEAAEEEARRPEEAAVDERRRRAELAADAAERRRPPAEETAEVTAEEQKQRRAMRNLFGAGEKLKQVNAKIEKLFGTSKADKSKKVIDVPDTMATRLNAPTEGGVRLHGQATSDTDQVAATAIQGQVGTGINIVTDSLGLFNDLRALKAAFKGRKATGPESHKPRKDAKGKPLAAAQNAGMVTGDAAGMANAAVRNAGQLGGVPALGEVAGGAGVFYSVLIAARDAVVIWKTYDKDRDLKKMVQEAPDDAQKDAGKLQDVLDHLGKAQQGLDRVRALPPRRLLDLNVAREEDIARFEKEVADLTGQLEAHLAGIGRYARHKQHTKLAKRVTSLGGNSVRTAGSSLAIAAAAGAVSGPAGPAVAGVAAAFLLGNALYKGARAGSNRYVAARHPDRWARPTLGEGESETDRPGAPEAQGARRRDAVADFFKVTKSVPQGQRQFMAQELYALAAGPDVRVGKDVPADIRASARALLMVLKAGPDRHGQSPKDWEASLNDPAKQAAWEKEIANQLSSA